MDLPYINTIDINGETYNLENLTDGNYLVELPPLNDDDTFVLVSNIVDNTNTSDSSKPLSAKQGRELRSSLNNEIARSTNRDAAIENKIGVDQIIEGKTVVGMIIDETNRAKGAEKTLTDNLNAEITRSTKKDTELDGNITKLRTDMGTNDASTLASAKSYTDTAKNTLNELITANTNSINTLKGTGAGSVKKTVDDAIAKVVANAPADFDTLKEMSDWISGHETTAAAMNSQINANKTALNNKSDKSHTHSYLPLAGGTLTGMLQITPPTGVEGGEIRLNASTAEITQNGIALDQREGDLRIFGLASADGTTFTGSGTPLVINPYSKTITGGYTFSGNSTSATKLQSARTIDGVAFDGSKNISHYVACETAGATAAKVVSLEGFNLVTGARIAILFNNDNTAASATLNVNNTGAKPILYRGKSTTAASPIFKKSHVYEFVYSGANYLLIGDVNTEYTLPAATSTTIGGVKISNDYTTSPSNDCAASTLAASNLKKYIDSKINNSKVETMSNNSDFNSLTVQGIFFCVGGEQNYYNAPFLDTHFVIVRSDGDTIYQYALGYLNFQLMIAIRSWMPDVSEFQNGWTYYYTVPASIMQNSLVKMSVNGPVRAIPDEDYLKPSSAAMINNETIDLTEQVQALTNRVAELEQKLNNN